MAIILDKLYIVVTCLSAKCENFTATQTLREIKFGNCSDLKTENLTILEALNFHF